MVAPSKRTLVSFYSNMFYVVGLMGFSGLAYVTPQWQLIALATSLPFVVYFLYILYASKPATLLYSFITTASFSLYKIFNCDNESKISVIFQLLTRIDALVAVTRTHRRGCRNVEENR